MHPLSRRLAALVLLGALPLATTPTQADTLQDVKARGVLRCAVNGAVPGLSFKDAQDHWSGIDVDFCRAVAAAVLGRRDKVELVPTPSSGRFDALRQGKVDLLARNTTWTLSRDLDPDVVFVGILYHDGQGFMVRRDTSTLSARELSRKPVCTAGISGPQNARTYFARNRMSWTSRSSPIPRRRPRPTWPAPVMP